MGDEDDEQQAEFRRRFAEAFPGIDVDAYRRPVMDETLPPSDLFDIYRSRTARDQEFENAPAWLRTKVAALVPASGELIHAQWTWIVPGRASLRIEWRPIPGGPTKTKFERYRNVGSSADYEPDPGPMIGHVAWASGLGFLLLVIGAGIRF